MSLISCVYVYMHYAIQFCQGVLCTLCSGRKIPYPPHGRSLEIPRGRQVLEDKIILFLKYEAKLEIPSVGGMWIFSKTVQFFPQMSLKKSTVVTYCFLVGCLL